MLKYKQKEAEKQEKSRRLEKSLVDMLWPLLVKLNEKLDRRLGRRWKVLHRLVYFAVPLSILHFFWLDRDIHDLVLVYAVYVAMLFVIRLPAIRQYLARKK